MKTNQQRSCNSICERIRAVLSTLDITQIDMAPDQMVVHVNNPDPLDLLFGMSIVIDFQPKEVPKNGIDLQKQQI